MLIRTLWLFKVQWDPVHVRDVLKRSLCSAGLNRILFYFSLLLRIIIVRLKRGRKNAAPCFFLMHLGTRLFPTSTELALPLIPGMSQMPTLCQRPLGDEERLERISLWSWGGEALLKSQIRLFWCRLQWDGWSCRNRICVLPGPASGNPPSLTFCCSQLWWLAAAGWCSQAGVCFHSSSCAWVGLFCCPGDRRVWYAFTLTRNSFLYLVTRALYSSSGLWPGCVVLEGWSVGWWPLVTSSGVAAAHDH